MHERLFCVQLARVQALALRTANHPRTGIGRSGYTHTTPDMRRSPFARIAWTEARSRLKQAETPGPVSSHSTLPAKRILSALRLRPAAEKFKKCNGFGFSGATTGRSCCVCHRAVGLFRTCCRSVIVVFLTCFSRVPHSARKAIKLLNHHRKSMTPGPEWPKRYQKTAITRDFGLKTETGSLETPCTTTHPAHRRCPISAAHEPAEIRRVCAVYGL